MKKQKHGKLSNLLKIIKLGYSRDRISGRVTHCTGLVRNVLVLALNFCILGNSLEDMKTSQRSEMGTEVWKKSTKSI